MNYSPKNSKTAFICIGVLISMVSLASWQFYTYATFKHDNGLFNIEGGGSHLIWALLLAGFACGLGFFLVSRLLRHEFDDQLRITSPPDRHTAK
jgi:hypothetical protein